MEDEGNFSSKAKGIVTIVVIALICLIAYFVYDNLLKPVRSIGTTSSTVTNAMKLITSINSLRGTDEPADSLYTDYAITTDNLSDKDKSWIVYSHITDKLTNLTFTCSALKGYYDTLYNDCNKYGVDYTFVLMAQKLQFSDFSSEYNTIFGSNSEPSTSNFGSVGVNGYYSKNNNDFLILTYSGVGGTDTRFVLRSLKDATTYPDKLEVEQYYALCSIGSDSTGLKCTAGTKTVKEDEKITTATGLDVTTFGRLYKFTFNKNADGSYYWYSTEPVEK